MSHIVEHRFGDQFKTDEEKESVKSLIHKLDKDKIFDLKVMCTIGLNDIPLADFMVEALMSAFDYKPEDGKRNLLIRDKKYNVQVRIHGAPVNLRLEKLSENEHGQLMIAETKHFEDFTANDWAQVFRMCTQLKSGVALTIVEMTVAKAWSQISYRHKVEMVEGIERADSIVQESIGELEYIFDDPKNYDATMEEVFDKEEVPAPWLAFTRSQERDTHRDLMDQLRKAAGIEQKLAPMTRVVVKDGVKLEDGKLPKKSEVDHVDAFGEKDGVLVMPMAPITPDGPNTDEIRAVPESEWDNHMWFALTEILDQFGSEQQNQQLVQAFARQSKERQAAIVEGMKELKKTEPDFIKNMFSS